MKAQLTNPAQNATISRERFRTGLILGGIVVAIIVSIFMSQEASGQTITPIIPSASTITKQVVHQSTGIFADAITNVIGHLF